MSPSDGDAAESGGAHYIIRGGDAGARRLHVLARAMLPGTRALLERVGLGPGAEVLDLGCGSGEVTVEIARRVGPGGRVVGVDMDERVLEHARSTAAEREGPIEWRVGRAEDLVESAAYDFVYARFLLSHLPDPSSVLRRMRDAVRPGGCVAVEDIDIAAHTHWPPSDAFRRYVELYRATARARGADSGIGPRLPGLLLDAALEDVTVSISMPVFREGEGKGIARMTLENIAPAAIQEGLAEPGEIRRLLEELTSHEADPRSIQSTAQVFQCTGRRPPEA